MSMLELLEENPKIQSMIAEVLDEGRPVEAPILEWISRITEKQALTSFFQLADSPRHFKTLSSIARLELSVNFEPFANDPTLVNFVLLLREIWKQKKDVEIFKPFSKVLHKRLNPSFVFESDFESLIYSHSHAMVYIIIVITILTIILVHQNEEDSSFAIFDKLDELTKPSRDFLKQEFKLILELFDEINNFIFTCFEKDLEENTGLESDKIPRMSVLSDLQIFKRIEEQELTVQRLTSTFSDLQTEKAKLERELEQSIRLNDEKDKEIHHLKFSREDLLEKLKNKQLEFINDALVDKDSEIRLLKERIQQTEQTHNSRLRDLEDEKEGLHKKLHMLQNYKAEFESIQTIAEKQTNDALKETQVKFCEEMQILKDKIARLQEASLADKERYLDLEMRLSKQNMEIHSLKMERQNLDYKVKELESHSEAMMRSEIYTDNIDQIAEELSSGVEVNKLQLMMGSNPLTVGEDSPKHGATQNPTGTSMGSDFFAKKLTSESTVPELNQVADLQNEIKYSFANYEKRCLARIKTVLKELSEEKEKSDELLKEINHLKEKVEEITEKNNHLESGLVDKLVEKSPAIQDLLKQMGGSSKDGSEIAQDLLKTVLKREQEIHRLKANRQKLGNEILSTEAKCIDTLNVLYTVIDAFFES